MEQEAHELFTLSLELREESNPGGLEHATTLTELGAVAVARYRGSEARHLLAEALESLPKGSLTQAQALFALAKAYHRGAIDTQAASGNSGGGGGEEGAEFTLGRVAVLMGEAEAIHRLCRSNYSTYVHIW